MIRKILTIFLLIPVLVYANKLTVFTDQLHPINDPDHRAEVCEIIDTNILINQINAELKRSTTKNPEVINKKYGKDFKKIGESYKCLNKAEKLGVTKLPTIIIGDKYIIGLTDIPLVINKYGEAND